MSNVVWISSERDWRRTAARLLKGGGAMAEDFERRLERLFAEHPELPDAGGFAERVERRLDAGWTARRWLIGSGGGVGGGGGGGPPGGFHPFPRGGGGGGSAGVV